MGVGTIPTTAAPPEEPSLMQRLSSIFAPAEPSASGLPRLATNERLVTPRLFYTPSTDVGLPPATAPPSTYDAVVEMLCGAGATARIPRSSANVPASQDRRARAS